MAEIGESVRTELDEILTKAKDGEPVNQDVLNVAAAAEALLPCPKHPAVERAETLRISAIEEMVSEPIRLANAAGVIAVHEFTWREFNALNKRRPSGKRAQRARGKEWRK